MPKLRQNSRTHHHTDKSITDIGKKLKDLGIQHKLKITSIGTKVFVDDDKQFQSLCSKLSESKAEYFTHPLNNTKYFILMLYGLPEVPKNEIASFLKAQNNATVGKILMLNADSSFKKYILHFDPKENTKADVKNIKVVLSHIIKWFPAKPRKKGPTQCLNCGMFGHGISSCHRKSKCLLCGEGHETMSVSR